MANIHLKSSNIVFLILNLDLAQWCQQSNVVTPFLFDLICLPYLVSRIYAPRSPWSNEPHKYDDNQVWCSLILLLMSCQWFNLKGTWRVDRVAIVQWWFLPVHGLPGIVAPPGGQSAFSLPKKKSKWRENISTLAENKVTSTRRKIKNKNRKTGPIEKLKTAKSGWKYGNQPVKTDGTLINETQTSFLTWFSPWL